MIFTKYLGKLLMAFAVELEKFEDAVTDLRREAVPGLSRSLLDRWETDLGLPDDVPLPYQSVEERAQIAHAKYTANYSGQSKEFFIEYAAKLGAVITIQEYAGYTSIFRVDKNRVDRMPVEGIDGSRLWSLHSKYKWTIEVISLDTVSLEYLQYRIGEIAPAHTIIIWI